MILFSEYFIPDGDEARRLAEEELSNPRYAEAQPTWFDLLARDVLRYLTDLFTPEGGGQVGPLALVIVCIVIVAALVAALIVWGRPRASRAVRGRGRDLLGDRDDRSAAQLRADAERSARSGDWDAATILRFRALARGLLERDLIDPAPGATAQAIARDTARVFADEAAALRDAAAAFDDVRYLEHPSSEQRYRQLAGLDERLISRHPEAVTA
ncbi:DUF4129 domain-containing protein [Microbacterium sp. CIAB417]|uniref:DUF4129 domain-containing protein n=1 Tax=Microbacterium sp. CIAB417 TaxID=2860287 RepID=UPI001FAD9F41|nr:DUF4129 domain-containing protein [Microbacterium sp. CIAB417]